MPRWLVVVIVCVVALGSGWWIGVATRTPATVSNLDIAGFVYPQPKALGEFDLTDHDNRAVDLARFKGRWTFVYLGYTYCPDVCPLTLVELDKVQQGLSKSRFEDDIQYLFVSVDPRRDTLERLREYTQYFNPTFVGATGSNEALTGFAQQLGMLFFPVAEDQENENYTVDHSSTVALIDPMARLHAVFSAPHSAGVIEEGLRKILKRWDDRAG